MSEPDVVRLTQELVRFDTVNPPGNEEPAMRHLGAALEASGVEVEYQSLGPQRVNLIARIRGPSREGGLVLSGHMDVVHPGTAEWASLPFEAAEVDGKIVGRGSADMKGGVAAMAVALIRLARSGFRPQSDVVLAVSCGEEVDTAGARLLASSGVLSGASGLVVGEPTGLDVYIAEKGVLWVRVTARGQTAHGAMPHLGVNAISYVCRVVEELEVNPPWHGIENEILGCPTLSVNTIEGGVKTNVVADHAAIAVDMRLIPGQDRETVLTTLENRLEGVRRSSGLDVTTQVEVLQYMPPVETPPGHPLAQAVISAARGIRGGELTVGGISYGTDGAILAPALNAALVIFGPGGTDQLHQTNEYVLIEELKAAVTAYEHIIRATTSSP